MKVASRTLSAKRFLLQRLNSFHQFHSVFNVLLMQLYFDNGKGVRVGVDEQIFDDVGSAEEIGFGVARALRVVGDRSGLVDDRGVLLKLL